MKPTATTIKITKDLNIRLLLALQKGEINPQDFPEFRKEGGFLEALMSVDEDGDTDYSIPINFDLKKRLLKAMTAGEIDLDQFPEFSGFAFAAFDRFMDKCLALTEEDIKR